MSSWSVEDTIVFFKECVTEKKKVLNNIRWVMLASLGIMISGVTDGHYRSNICTKMILVNDTEDVDPFSCAASRSKEVDGDLLRVMEDDELEVRSCSRVIKGCSCLPSNTSDSR